MVSIQTADNALKSFYLDAVAEALNYKANPFLAQIAQSTSNVVGKDVKKLLKGYKYGGVYAGSETGDLPKAEDTERLVLTATLKNLYGTIEISDKAMRASTNDEGAFVNLLNDEMQTLINRASYNFSRMIFGDGNGFLTKFEGLTDDYAIVENVDDLYVGMHVAIYDSLGETIGGYEDIIITDIERETRKVYFDIDDTLFADLTEDCSLNVVGAHGYELTGLKAIFNSSELYGLDKGISPALQPYVKKEVGDIDMITIQTALDAIEQASGKGVNFIVCSWGVRRALVEYLRQNTVTPQSMDIMGGFKALSFNGIPVVADRFCPKGTMYLLNTDDFKIHQLCDWKWLEGEDGKILKQVPGKPVYTATLVKYAELLCDRPNGQGMLTGIAEM